MKISFIIAQLSEYWEETDQDKYITIMEVTTMVCDTEVGASTYLVGSVMFYVPARRQVSGSVNKQVQKRYKVPIVLISVLHQQVIAFYMLF